MAILSSHPQAAQRPEKKSELLRPATKAPDFTLHVTPDQSLTLSELAGKPVVLAFYPADWSPVCGDQMALYNEALPEFEKFGAQILGISVDGVCVTRHLRSIATSTSRCLPISSRKGRSPSAMAPIATAMVSASGRFS
jgi:thiol-disulfide isomerase/thioredoxin